MEFICFSPYAGMFRAQAKQHPAGLCSGAWSSQEWCTYRQAAQRPSLAFKCSLIKQLTLSASFSLATLLCLLGIDVVSIIYDTMNEVCVSGDTDQQLIIMDLHVHLDY